MLDVRQGPLPTYADPLSTAAERCVAGVLDRVVPLRGPAVAPAPITSMMPASGATRFRMNGGQHERGADQAAGVAPVLTAA